MRDTIVSDTFAHLLQPDTLLPSQYFAALKRKGQHEPERRLAIAVLQDAVDCYQKHLCARDRKARQLFLDAEEWITAEDRTWFFAFENVCDTLGLAPEYLRAGLLKWRAAERRRVGDAAVAAVVRQIEEDPIAEDEDTGRGGLRLVHRG